MLILAISYYSIIVLCGKVFFLIPQKLFYATDLVKDNKPEVQIFSGLFNVKLTNIQGGFWTAVAQSQ